MVYKCNAKYRQTFDVSHTLVSNISLDHSDRVGAAPIQLNLHSQVNIWLQLIGQRKVQDGTKNGMIYRYTSTPNWCRTDWSCSVLCIECSNNRYFRGKMPRACEGVTTFIKLFPLLQMMQSNLFNTILQSRSCVLSRSMSRLCQILKLVWSQIYFYGRDRCSQLFSSCLLRMWPWVARMPDEDRCASVGSVITRLIFSFSRKNIL